MDEGGEVKVQKAAEKEEKEQDVKRKAMRHQMR